ncbi:MAG TPA: PH domain-containing protein [Longimicrobiales bacterium]|nr:PH domain-containing protein [Longimicrobiales bacterium]
MPSEGRRLHGFTIISRALRLARQLLLPAIVGGASAGGDLAGTLQWVLLILSVPSLLIAVSQWLAFRFRLEGDELILDSGVLARRRRVIPLPRVQNIDLEQSFLERLAGVASLRLETASGGSETEASLAVLALGEAQDLQAELMRRRHRAQESEPHATAAAAATEGDAAGSPSAAGTPGPRGEARPLLRLGVTDLAIAGATSNEAGLIAAGLATLLELGDGLGGIEWLGRTAEELFGRGAEIGVAGAILAGALLAIAFFIMGWVVSIGATIVRFHGFTLTRVGADLRREYGLLSRHRSTVPLERVQAVRIEESLLRRPLGLSALKIETAGAAPGRNDRPGGRAEAFVPLARRRDVGRLLRAVFEDARLDGVTLNPVAPVSRRRGFRRLAVPIVFGAGVLALWLDRNAIALLLLLGPAWVYARAQYRARAWARAGGYALARGGVFTRVTWVVPDRKIQTLHFRESPFQRRRGIGTVLIDTAAGGRVARIVDVRRETGLGLLLELARRPESEAVASPGLPAGGRRGPDGAGEAPSLTGPAAPGR